MTFVHKTCGVIVNEKKAFHIREHVITVFFERLKNKQCGDSCIYNDNEKMESPEQMRQCLISKEKMGFRDFSSLENIMQDENVPQKAKK